MRWHDLPKWEEMPKVPGMPNGCAWGLFDQNGERDQLGTLNLLTPEIVLKARDEIQNGQSICLKLSHCIRFRRLCSNLYFVRSWSMEHAQVPAVNRKQFEHRIISLRRLGHTAYDDEIAINTQSGSQWDGLRHWGHQETGLYYNNLAHDAIRNNNCKDNSIHYWSLRGGIVGRGVLIDYHSWATARSLHHPAIARTTISSSEIEEIAKSQGTELQPADILLIRTGWTAWYNGASESERRKGTTGNEHIGLEGTEDTVKWLWNKHFAAVASDSLAFEAWPTKPPYGLHDWLLAMWGCPIGELWNLEELSEKCRTLRKWSFFIASAPLNVVGGVASPPNVVAIL
ncbi:uncharacterized protein Z518_06471 [Rhinocladiella mackenziei CBS 650.93]|uniref:Cyclase n=1 Tax=Rhinocladiella mackenziei CBS 650.93 TaxID=1442369 RepID=A0A0D2IIN2_9EURO|nr:uncharacterized protein Z518_06471 [Rhinocladiella mackenziei CBS 650.93]KIX05599.1 hypothetical protein Z518_06471 [Rhinocladiella mackenziei CBS 650.93]